MLEFVRTFLKCQYRTLADRPRKRTQLGMILTMTMQKMMTMTMVTRTTMMIMMTIQNMMTMNMVTIMTVTMTLMPCVPVQIFQVG